MRASVLSLIVGIAVISVPALYAEDFDAERAQVVALGRLTTPPATRSATGYAEASDIRAIYFDGLPFRGNPTKIFGWLGLPKDRAGKVPAMVLVHGGGGTAFKEWVQKWNDRGFAAISIAVEGQTDQRETADPQVWQRHDWAGPARDGIYGDSALPLPEQWMYHAVGDTILANSLLRSLPEVNADMVGLMGISWGGVIASTVIGIDSRFAFAIPTYGCGHLYDDPNQYGRTLGSNRLYREVWDPMVRLERVEMPVLWLSWPEDQHFAMDCLAACYDAAPGPHMVSLIPRMNHGHDAGWNPPDSYAFAESIVITGKPWCVQTQVKAENDMAFCEFESTKPLDQAVLVSTTDTGFTGARKWCQSPARLSEQGKVWHVNAPLPTGTTAWFLNVHSGRLTASSDFQEQQSIK